MSTKEAPDTERGVRGKGLYRFDGFAAQEGDLSV
jgi:hypothetical protein